MLSSDQVFDVRVKTVRFREGYNADQVDDFLESAVQSLKWLESGQITGPDGEIPLGPDDVRAITFATTKYDSAYDMRQVDELLTSIEQTLEHYVRAYRGGATLNGAGTGAVPLGFPPAPAAPVAPAGPAAASHPTWNQPLVGYPVMPTPMSGGGAPGAGAPGLGAPGPVQSVGFPVNSPQALPVQPQIPMSPPAADQPDNKFPTVGY